MIVELLASHAERGFWSSSALSALKPQVLKDSSAEFAVTIVLEEMIRKQIRLIHITNLTGDRS
jgi:hypothetical protein